MKRPAIPAAAIVLLLVACGPAATNPAATQGSAAGMDLPEVAPAAGVASPQPVSPGLSAGNVPPAPAAGTAANQGSAPIPAVGTPAAAGAQTGTPAPPPKPQSPWKPLAEDLLHDPFNPALPLLQEPEEALSVLPPAKQGNHVDWVAALRSGAIQPRTNIYPETKIRVIDLDILFEDTAGQPMVLFPHRPHTEWLDCENCHDKIFIEKKGANDFGMLDILEGRYCGQCHGAVAFPLTQCQRCHSVPHDSAKAP